MRLRAANLVVLGVLLLGGCSVDVDDYRFVSDDEGGPPERELAMRLMEAQDRAQGEWATRCVEGSDEPDDERAGSKYVYTLDDEELRLDMFAYTTDCEAPLWVQSIEAEYEVSGVDRDVEDAFELTLEIIDRRIMLLSDTVAEEANLVDVDEDGEPDGLFGRTNWVAGEWFDLLGVTTGDQGEQLEEGREAFVLIVFLERDRAIGASVVTVGAVPRSVLEVRFERSDGSESAIDF